MRNSTMPVANGSHPSVTRALMYLRVSTAEQAESGLGIAAQRRAVLSYCETRGWPVIELPAEDESARSLNRPVLRDALARLDAGEADVLVVSRLCRLTRSLKDFCSLIEDYRILALDSPADPTTVHGEAMQRIQVVFNELERRVTGQRTREALAVLRAQGVQLGRPRVVPADVRDRIRRERDEDGRTWAEIARRLTADGIPTAHGATKWADATVRKIALSA